MLNSIFFADDWLSVECKTADEIAPTAEKMRATGQWREVVAGLSSIAVQFDPAQMLPTEALDMFAAQLLGPLDSAASAIPEAISLPICYAPEFALDAALIAAALDIAPAELGAWHAQQTFTVAMLGFLPGFAYLRSAAALPDLKRLDVPRTRVVAGSVGFLGTQNCLYPFDSPGGWPIIGRTPVKLFDKSAGRPSLLAPGQQVRFHPVDKQQFEAIVSGTAPWR